MNEKTEEFLSKIPSYTIENFKLLVAVLVRIDADKFEIVKELREIEANPLLSPEEKYDRWKRLLEEDKELEKIRKSAVQNLSS